MDSLIPKGIYRHFKGQLYRVLGTARHCETEEVLVVYQALYGEHGYWLRPLHQFQDRIEYQGREQQRFSWLES